MPLKMIAKQLGRHRFYSSVRAGASAACRACGSVGQHTKLARPVQQDQPLHPFRLPNGPTGPTTFLPDGFGKTVDRSVIRGPFKKIEIAERLAQDPELYRQLMQQLMQLAATAL
jgi:hypothetical protein